MIRMTISGEQTRTSTERRGRPGILLLAAVLAFVNLLAVLLEVNAVLNYYEDRETTDYIVNQDLWFPLMLAVWAQAVVNGLILVAWKRTRTAGVGVLLGAVAAVVAYFGFIVLVLAPQLA
jgi:hypothetical protein